ncbi:hypothetical protein GGE06_000870 [Streptomyces sp. SFB5A]|uniref:Uncharacterized protein n=1 Tax=Streptomyces nymphaeiformis TaxID=2663842 RepID=A0A7W7X9L4_9ACTN|nr:hypothetical protein [Streptomyces nymphaeiformis]
MTLVTCMGLMALVFVVSVRLVLHGSAPHPVCGSCLRWNRIPP